jgi:hypothetical protein
MNDNMPKMMKFVNVVDFNSFGKYHILEPVPKTEVLEQPH